MLSTPLCRLTFTMLLIGAWAGAVSAPSLAGEPPALPDPLFAPAPEKHEKEVEIDLLQLQKTVGQAVVKIMFTPISNLGEIKDDPRQQEQYESGWSAEPAHGSGFFIHTEGIIVTNAHVVDSANRRTLKCKSPATGSTTFELELIGVGETGTIDLAILRLKQKERPRFLKLSGFKSIPFLTIADSDKVSQTEKIAVMGYPEDSDDMRIKAANLSGRQYLKDYGELIGGFQFLEVVTASAVQHGNSGGAAINRFGELIGIPARGTWTARTGWLIPSNVFIRFIQEISTTGQGLKKLKLLNLGVISEKTFPGIAAIAGLTEDFIDHEVGMAIHKVSKKSLAAEWGLKGGDILLSFRNFERNIHVYLDYEGRVKTTGAMRVFRDSEKSWDNTDAPRRNLGELFLMSTPGQEVALQFVRKGVKGITEIRKKIAYREILRVPHLGTFEVPDFVEWGGMILQNFHDNNVGHSMYYTLEKLIQAGAVKITHIDSGSLAQERNLNVGQVISAINGIPTRNLVELRKILKQIDAEYDAWKKSEGFDEGKARYSPQNYALVRYHVWDDETDRLIQRDTTLPIERARAVGRSLDSSGK
ncbi:MAG: trypsin-like peptidase domain-containing protein [Planctomycetota bacterium]|jgi:S1-C subfamily serine protease